MYNVTVHMIYKPGYKWTISKEF